MTEQPDDPIVIVTRLTDRQAARLQTELDRAVLLDAESVYLSTELADVDAKLHRLRNA